MDQLHGPSGEQSRSRFLSVHSMIEQSPKNKTIILSCGFAEAITVTSSDKATTVTFLEVHQEETVMPDTARHPRQFGVDHLLSL